MKLLLIDIDTLRPDHLGCYGVSAEHFAKYRRYSG